MSKHVGDGIPGWDWKPYKVGSYRKTCYHIETKSGETYYQCWPNAGYFHPLLDSRAPKEGIHESEVAYVLEVDRAPQQSTSPEGGALKRTFNRLEIIDHTDSGTGRDYVKWVDKPFEVSESIQDDGRTLKIFLATPQQSTSPEGSAMPEPQQPKPLEEE